MIKLVEKDGYINFLMGIKSEDTEFDIEFEVYKVTAWSMDNSPSEHELYLKGRIKWDGCSHIVFGEAGDGYMHLCGVGAWNNHVLLMNELIEYASKNISRWDKLSAE